MPKYKVTVQQYERHVATYEEEVDARNKEEAVSAAIKHVLDGSAGEPDLTYCDLPDDSGSLAYPGVSEHRIYAALTLAGVLVDDADGPCVASIRSAHAKEMSSGTQET